MSCSCFYLYILLRFIFFTIFFFFFSSRRRHTRLVSDWSSDVCSSDLVLRQAQDDRSEPVRTEPVEVPECTGPGPFDKLRANGPLISRLGNPPLHQRRCRRNIRRHQPILMQERHLDRKSVV